LVKISWIPAWFLLAPAVSAVDPYAPQEALLPAARVKLSIDRAIVITEGLISNTSDSNKILAKSEAIKELDDILLKPQNYVKDLKLQGVPSKPADLYLQSYQSMKGDLPFQLYLSKNGDISAWKDIKKREKEQERTSEIRTALNAYTDALSFSSDSYVLNVDKATKSSMVREDRLPELKQVITSDMGMRYLYRNQILTAMDDVKAELVFQLSLIDEGKPFDGEDLLDLLYLAEKAFDRWFSLINPNDVKEAFQTVSKET